ncbi:MAG: DUF933 domain-containing protein [Candidatus Omnitrophica bacterium]|nr:DUF933 domain-containing protein [Candidatus Omnitrophota bacterium]
MKIGIIGPLQSGKTTIFKILLQSDVSGNIGVFKAVDHRVDKIAKAFSSKKTTYPELTFVDLGVTSGFKKKDLSQLQDIDLFICVAGAFFSQDPKKDFESALTDIILFDLEVIQDRIAKLQKEKKAGTEQELKALEKCQTALSDGRLLHKAGLEKEELRLFSGLTFLSLRPLIMAINVSDEDKRGLKALEEYCASKDMRFIRFSGKTELELLELEPEEREKFHKEMGLGQSFREEMSKLVMKELELITFFTTGEKETRGWYLKSGLPAIEAAGKIHTDMKRGFIRAEIVNFEDFIKCGSMPKAREAGVLKVEGKDYIVRDGDIINVRFSV